jgi:hypothetical protein
MIPDELKALFLRLTDDERCRLALMIVEDLLPGKGLALFMWDKNMRTFMSTRDKAEIKPILAEWALNELFDQVKAAEVADGAIAKAAAAK